MRHLIKTGVISLTSLFMLAPVSADIYRLESSNIERQGWNKTPLFSEMQWEDFFPNGATKFVVYLDFTPSEATQTDYPFFDEFTGGVRSITLEWRDADDNIIAGQYPFLGGFPIESHQSSILTLPADIGYYPESFVQIRTDFPMTLNGLNGTGVQLLSMSLPGTTDLVSEAVDGVFPDIDFETYINNGGNLELYQTFRFNDGDDFLVNSVNGTISSVNITPSITDEDGDGVADEADLCPVSITDATVSFGDGSVVADVENVYDANGCSIMDRYAACEAVEEEAPRRGIRSVRSGPSSCEKAVSYDLVADGVISYAEARLLRNALYEAN